MITDYDALRTEEETDRESGHNEHSLRGGVRPHTDLLRLDGLVRTLLRKASNWPGVHLFVATDTTFARFRKGQR